MKIAFYCPLKPISHPNPSGDREIARGLHTYLAARSKIFVLSEFQSKFFYQELSEIFSWLAALVAAYRLAKKEKPDLFFTYHLYYKAPDPIGFLLAWWFGKPFYVFEGMFARDAARKWGSWIGYFFTKAALGYATKIFSDKSKDYSYLDVWFPGKTLYLPPSVDVDFYQAKPGLRQRKREELGLGEVLTIVTVAMLRPDRKSEGVEFLIRCLKRLADDGVDFRWLHVGGGECEDSVKRLSDSSIGKKGKFLGVLESAEVAAVLAAGDVFAFPGLDEGFGLVYVEAQAAGLPVVAFDNGGVPDAVSGEKSGFLTPVLDEEKYTAALKRLAQDPLLRAEMGKNAEAFAREKFDRARNYAQLWKVLSEQAKGEKHEL